MSKRYPRAKWQLPIDVNPETSTCWRVPVPDDRFHKSAFLGALATLGSAVSWADDAGHTALVAAAVWRDIADSLEECGMPAIVNVRQNVELPCILEKSEDGEEWTQFANLQLCPPLIRRNSGITEWFDGTIWIPLPGDNDERFTGTFDSPYPDGSVSPGQSAECLSAVNIVAIYSSNFNQAYAGFIAGQLSVEVVGAITAVLALFIPIEAAVAEFLTFMGAAFSAGEAAVGDFITEATLETITCALNDNAQSDGSYDALGFAAIQDSVSDEIENILTRSGVLIWLSGLGPVGLSRMATAAGLMVGDCDVCSDTWTHTFDFTVDGQGWEPFIQGGCNNAVYNMGEGWSSEPDCRDSWLSLWYPEFDEREITGITINWDVVMTGDTKGLYVAAPEEGGGYDMYTDGLSTETSFYFEADGSTATNIYVAMFNDGSSDGLLLPSKITSIVVSGNGIDPFA